MCRCGRGRSGDGCWALRSRVVDRELEPDARAHFEAMLRHRGREIVLFGTAEGEIRGYYAFRMHRVSIECRRTLVVSMRPLLRARALVAGPR